jgi:hypothetical protein
VPSVFVFYKKKADIKESMCTSNSAAGSYEMLKLAPGEEVMGRTQVFD